MAMIKIPNYNLPQSSIKTFHPQVGDRAEISGQIHMFDGNNWISLMSNATNKPTRMIDELAGEKTEDVVETLLLLLIKNGILKDIDEFKEILQANKLANKLSEME